VLGFTTKELEHESNRDVGDEVVAEQVTRRARTFANGEEPTGEEQTERRFVELDRVARGAPRLSGPRQGGVGAVAAVGEEAPEATERLADRQGHRQGVAGGEVDAEDLLAELAAEVAAGQGAEHRLAVDP